MDTKPSSPCLDICAFNKTTGTCIACFRTIQEIAQWGCLEESERLRIMNEVLPARKAKHKSTGCDTPQK